jgi:putative membrane protein
MRSKRCYFAAAFAACRLRHEANAMIISTRDAPCYQTGTLKQIDDPRKRRTPCCSFSSRRSKTRLQAGSNGPSSKSEIRTGSMMDATLKTGKVPYGESSRKYRRTVYSYDDWVEHRSPNRTLSNLQKIFFSGVIRQLQGEVLLVSFIASLVVLWNGVLVPLEAAGGLLPYLSLPSLPFTLSSPALGLLLVFRTNASYNRWSEARMLWSKVTSQSQNAVRMASTFADMTQPGDQEALSWLGTASWLYCRSLMNVLSGPEDGIAYRDEIQKELCRHEHGEQIMRRLMDSPKRDISALSELSIAIDKLPIDEKRRVEIDKSAVLLGDVASLCERLYTTPVPLVYTRHTGRMLSLWMVLVPLALFKPFASPHAGDKGIQTAEWITKLDGIAVVPATALIALFLFGIDELAMQLEEPFSVLPMQTFCDSVKGANNGIIDWSIASRGSDNELTSRGSDNELTPVRQVNTKI